MLIKHNIPRDVDAISGHMKTFVSFMKRAITKENTLLGTKLELALVIWTEMGPASTPKHLEKGVVRLFIKETSMGVFIFKTRVGVRLMRKHAVVKASLQKRNGTDAWAKRVRPASTM